MPVIGTLKAKENGGYSVNIKTMTRNVSGEMEALPPEAKRHEQSPDFRVFNEERVQIGVAWRKSSQRAYFSFQFDDPFLPSTIQATSHQREDGMIVLLWNRQTW